LQKELKKMKVPVYLQPMVIGKAAASEDMPGGDETFVEDLLEERPEVGAASLKVPTDEEQPQDPPEGDATDSRPRTSRNLWFLCVPVFLVCALCYFNQETVTEESEERAARSHGMQQQ
jgi:hypothetical protein